MAALLAAMHLGAAVPLALVPLAPGLRAAGALALLGSLAWYLVRHAWGRRSTAVEELELATDGSFSVRLRGGAFVPAVVRDHSVVLPWLATLQLGLDGRRHDLALVLLPDMLPADDFRRLRSWLRWGRKTGDQEP